MFIYPMLLYLQQLLLLLCCWRQHDNKPWEWAGTTCVIVLLSGEKYGPKKYVAHWRREQRRGWTSFPIKNLPADQITTTTAVRFLSVPHSFHKRPRDVPSFHAPFLPWYCYSQYPYCCTTTTCGVQLVAVVCSPSYWIIELLLLLLWYTLYYVEFSLLLRKVYFWFIALPRPDARGGRKVQRVRAQQR